MKIEAMKIQRDLLDSSDSYNDVQDEELQKIIRGFLTSLSAEARALDSASTGQRWQEVAQIAHRLRAAGLFGFSDVGDAAGRLQRILDKGTPIERDGALRDLAAAMASAVLSTPPSPLPTI